MKRGNTLARNARHTVSTVFDSPNWTKPRGWRGLVRLLWVQASGLGVEKCMRGRPTASSSASSELGPCNPLLARGSGICFRQNSSHAHRTKPALEIDSKSVVPNQTVHTNAISKCPSHCLYEQILCLRKTITYTVREQYEARQKLLRSKS